MDVLASAYGSDEEENTSTESPRVKGDLPAQQMLNSATGPIKFDVKPINCAPSVPDKVIYQQPAVDPSTKEITYNPTYEELFAPQVSACVYVCMHTVGTGVPKLRGPFSIVIYESRDTLVLSRFLASWRNSC